jgi:murein DD-endopeptidase MepM/ murein hydrolase activator NlpD
VDYGFVEDVTVTASQMSADTQFDLDAIYDALTAQTVEEAYYTVVKGDTFVNIAKSLDMTMDELEALNPDVTPSSIFVGQQLVIQQSVPFLSVYTLDTETYEETIESPVEYTETDSMYVGETKVSVQGEDGVAQVTADVTYINGYETQRDVTDTVTLVEATTTQVLKGTKEKPKTASTGTYKYPVSGYTITSRYGYRSGEFHTGVDLAVPYGTAVKAADGGTVTFAGRQGNYGNLVIITHDDGSQTYYAHNSSILVSVGDKVYQGQQIAKAGSTGRSTGNHCHFEIRINGSTVNPFNYLK